MPFPHKRTSITIRKHESIKFEAPANQFKIFEKNWGKAGRIFSLSEQMALMHKNKLSPKERYKLYKSNAEDLLNTLYPASEKTEESTFEKCERVFNELKPKLLKDQNYYGKYVAIVNGKLEGVGDIENELVKQMDQKFGNVEMFVDQITSESKKIIIDTPEVR